MDATLGATVQYASELRLQACMHAKLLDVGRWSYSSCAVQLCRGVEYLASMSLNGEVTRTDTDGALRRAVDRPLLLPLYQKGVTISLPLFLGSVKM